MSNVLVFAAHPDDEVLGVGGTMVKHAIAGDSVYVAIATKAYPPTWSEEYILNKTKEQVEVDRLLGVKKRFNLDFPTVKLNTIPSGEFNKSVSEVVKAVEPDIVYTHFGHDLNQDHQILSMATRVACRPPKRIRLLFYETISETEWGDAPFHPNVYIGIKGCLQAKIDAFEKYKSEVKPLPHPRNAKGITTLAEKRGHEAMLDYAEAFQLEREVLL